MKLGCQYTEQLERRLLSYPLRFKLEEQLRWGQLSMHLWGRLGTLLRRQLRNTLWVALKEWAGPNNTQGRT